MSVPTAEGGVASGFGDIVSTQTFFGTAGGSGGGMSQSSAGGSIKPISLEVYFNSKLPRLMPLLAARHQDLVAVSLAQL
jgi:hypothetical protein